jgi:prephenate dehydratase/chorismate mutase/prephenate dehydratase
MGGDTMGLKNIRDKIDAIDSKILKLLNSRMEQAIIARKYKTRVEDTGREQEILDRIESDTGELISPEFCKKLFKEIMNESKKLQERNYDIIAFQGEHGAYSEMAAKSWNKDLISIPCSSFADVFNGVESGRFEYGIVPVENTLGGIVGDVNRNLMGTKLNIVGAIENPVEHCLLTLPGTDHREIKKVYSHSQALSQCKNFLERNNLEPVPYYDTAGSAKMLSEERLEGAAVIASKFAAVLYNLEIIKSNIEDSRENKTRFFILSKEKMETNGDKCSIFFKTEHKAGTLFRALELFAKADVNLTRIESMPEKMLTSAFFVDFIGSEKDEKIQKVLNEVSENTKDLRILGCYKEIKN